MTAAPLAALRARATARFVFVAGKGGVGKTTTASALALALADAGEATHLVSTDPAHSLGDVLDQDLAGGAPAPCACSPSLVLEEFDAAAYARAWLDAAAEPLAELIDRGTYLDAEDGRALLSLSLPGVDEVAAALRLAELDAGGAARVVVDTAPTGHTLHLLDAAALLAGWVAAFRAMADRAAAVASALTRARVRLRAEDVIDRLERDARAFQRVLERADFVLVSTDSPVVRAETARLREALGRRGHHIAAEVRTGGEEGDVVGFPVLRGARGCAALRALEPAALAAGLRPAAAPAATSRGRAGLEALFAGREILLWAGKGGVGKSTCAAACALALARAVRLLSVDPAGSLADVLDTPLPEDGAEAATGLHARQFDPAAEFDRFRARWREELDRAFARLGLDGAAGAGLDRRVLDALWNASPPGLSEIFGFAALLEGAGSATLVVDAAPTGHFLRLLAMPDLALEWVHALIRILLDYRAALGLGDTAETLLRLARRIRGLRAVLADERRTAVFVVTLDEPVVLAEVERLEAALAGAGLASAGMVHNRIAPAAWPPRRPPQREARPRIAAPFVDPPPRGAAALLRFYDRWELVA